MKDEIKRFKAAEIKESLYSILWVTIAVVIILGLSIFAKNATVIFFTVLIYFSLLYLAIKGYFEVTDEIESRVLIKELLKEGQVKISLDYCGSGEVSVSWIKMKNYIQQHFIMANILLYIDSKLMTKNV